MTDEELIQQYLDNGGTITKQIPKNSAPEPYKGKLLPTNVHTKIRHDIFGRREYAHLNKSFSQLTTTPADVAGEITL